MTDQTLIQKLRSLKKRKQLLVAAVVSTFIFAVMQIILQLGGDGFDNVTVGYFVAIPICIYMLKSIIHSSAGGEKIKETDSDDFYSKEETK